MRFQTILCPLDFSEFSRRALEYAQSLAFHYQAHLHVMHCVSPLVTAFPSMDFPPALEDVRRQIFDRSSEELVRLLKDRKLPSVEIQASTLEGDPYLAILAQAADLQANLIVMGTHGRKGLDHFILGSVCEKVLRKAPCPVLVVRKPAHEFIAPQDPKDPIHLSKILCCVDFSENSQNALLYALSLAEEYQAQLTLLHVMEDFPLKKELPELTAEVVAQLDALVPRQDLSTAGISSKLRIGKPHDEIIHFAAAQQTDLIIMGVRGRNALDLAIFGSTTHRVIQKGPCPVLTLPLPKRNLA